MVGWCKGRREDSRCVRTSRWTWQWEDFCFRWTWTLGQDSRWRGRFGVPVGGAEVGEVVGKGDKGADDSVLGGGWGAGVVRHRGWCGWVCSRRRWIYRDGRGCQGRKGSSMVYWRSRQRVFMERWKEFARKVPIPSSTRYFPKHSTQILRRHRNGLDLQRLCLSGAAVHSLVKAVVRSGCLCTWLSL